MAADATYRDTLQARITTDIMAYLDTHPKLMATEVDEVISVECPSEIRKMVLLTLQKQGLIRLKGDRRSAYYERVFKRRCAITINNRTIAQLMSLYGYEGTRAVLHAIDPGIFPAEGPTREKPLPLP